jgi:murein DD-endopeptidase MepM/ murein hydrolase activator NlpD
MSFLGSAGMVVAQTSTLPEMPTVPSAQDLFSTPQETVPVELAPSVALEPQPAPPEEMAPAPEAMPTEEVEPAIAIPSTAPTEAQTPAVDAEIAPPPAASLVAPDLAEKAKALGSNYIDSTSYGLGATTYQAPSAVVLSDRSSGCQAVVNKGEAAPGSICAQLQTGSVAQSQGGGSAPAYAGGYNSVSLGPVSLSSYGIGLSGRSTPSGRDYYNLTSRPPARLGTGSKLMFPLSIPAAITSAFGWRVHPISGESRFHAGSDIGVDEGTPVLAAFAGKVEIADFMGGYGLTVVLRHNKETEETLYGHMSEIFVKPGETVKQGEVIGRVGSTGFSTGPHLHFEFRQKADDGSWVTMDPGQALDYSLAHFLTNLQLAQTKKPLVAQVVVDPLQRLKVILQETKQAHLVKQDLQSKAQVVPKQE